MAIEWTDELATGSGAIDDQHKELFRRINALVDACQKSQGKQQIADVLKFLEVYVLQHFLTEEGYMARYGYPRAAEHKHEHGVFVEKFTGLKNLLASEGPTLVVVTQTTHLLIDWLRNHIMKTDRELGTFLKEHLPGFC
jgi:hemerythrin